MQNTTRSKIDCKDFFDSLSELGVDQYLGVPDSLLKDFCGYISDNVEQTKHIITVNEGQAIAIAAGYHLATKNIPLIYLQNSGLGNLINPIMSLAHSKVYGFPMLILMGWRGKPGEKDEPQHMVMGECMEQMIESTQCKHIILTENYKDELIKAHKIARETNSPVFLIVSPGYFASYQLLNTSNNAYPLNRESALEILLTKLNEGIFVGTTGFLSRELYELREKLGQKNNMDFLSVGSMGYASSIALGIALNQREKRVYCFDGDGAALMHLGCMAIIGQQSPCNLVHFLFNNLCHDSVGQQPTSATNVEFTQIALSSGYQSAYSVENEDQINNVVQNIIDQQMFQKGPIFVEIKIKPGARKDLGRPKTTATQNKNQLIEYIQSLS